MKSMIKDYNEKYFFIIFSFSFMLNNIIKIDSHNNNSNNQIFNDDLQCNSRERQLLVNLLKVFDTYLNLHYDSFEINSYVQSLVINNLLKTRAEDMFDSHLQMKNNFTIEKLEEIMSKNCKNEEVLKEFENFMNTKVSRGNNNSINPIATVLKLFFRSALDYRVGDKTIDCDSVSLTPFDPFTLSTNVCLCISGFTSDGIDQQKAWENFTLDLNKFIDFYYFNWPSETTTSFVKDILLFIGSSVINYLKEDYVKLISDVHAYATTSNLFLKAKKNAAVCGKLLAYLIASKTIFKFQTINLVGFSLGTHLIKHCLKELDRLSQYDSSLKYVVQNVILVAGATTFKNSEKWVKRFRSLVAGRVINIHGKNDRILRFLFKITTRKNAIGYHPVDMLNYENFENCDFSELNIDHYEYRKYFHTILKRIKFI
jgi:hypothetical protein